MVTKYSYRLRRIKIIKFENINAIVKLTIKYKFFHAIIFICRLGNELLEQKVIACKSFTGFFSNNHIRLVFRTKYKLFNTLQAFQLTQ